jgi:hypothetical protein
LFVTPRDERVVKKRRKNLQRQLLHEAAAKPAPNAPKKNDI